MSTSLDLEGQEFCQNGKNTEANKDIRGLEQVYNKAEGSTIQTKVQQLHYSSLMHTFTTHRSESLNFVNLPPPPFIFNDLFFFKWQQNTKKCGKHHHL